LLSDAVCCASVNRRHTIKAPLPKFPRPLSCSCLSVNDMWVYVSFLGVWICRQFLRRASRNDPFNQPLGWVVAHCSTRPMGSSL
jgi:hypothetical protein